MGNISTKECILCCFVGTTNGSQKEYKSSKRVRFNSNHSESIFISFSKKEKSAKNVDFRLSKRSSIIKSSKNTTPSHLRKSFSRSYASVRDPSYYTDYIGKVTAKYEVLPEEIGSGNFGVVRKCIDKETQQVYAVKSIVKVAQTIEDTLREIEILRTLKHPNVINLVDVFEDEKFIHVVTPFCEGGELLSRLTSKIQVGEAFSEKDTAAIVFKILDGIAYCHNHGVVHRDLKPENLMYVSEDSSEIKIIDFGLSTQLKLFSSETIKSRCGTLLYMSPEVIRREYTKACDIWSLGVIIFVLLSGSFPFHGENEAEAIGQIETAQIEFKDDVWKETSEEAKELIELMLSREPSQRPTAEEALVHPWFEKMREKSADEPVGQRQRSSLLHTHFLKERLGRYVGMSRFKKTAIAYIAQQLTRFEIGYLEEVFQQIDENGDGMISMEELCQALAQEDPTGMWGEIAQDHRQEAKTLLSGLDLDMNDGIDYHEFIAAAVNAHMVMQEENLMLAFNHFDKRGTGSISASDLEEIFGSLELAKEAVGEIDINKDGVISFEEFKEMMLKNTV